MTTIKLLLSALVVSTTIMSCIEPVYIPNKTSIPMFRREKQGYANAATVDDAGITLNGAYAFYGPLYVGAGGNINYKLTPFTESFRTNFFFGELGSFYPIDRMFSIEFGGGYGLGSSETYDEFDTDTVKRYDHNDVSYNRLHLQSSLCIHINLTGNIEKEDPKQDLILEAAVTGRFSFLNTTRYDVTHYDPNRVVISTETKSYSQTFIEPSVTIRMGIEYLMLEAQIGSSKIPGDPENAIPHKDSFLSIGLVSRF
jgi:hypothetical protein